ncbi:MAG: hypothetical protein KF762_06405 [Acidobacteria bacterium]|nr:hypothetical protein [Acidobacteriota bacterium]
MPVAPSALHYFGVELTGRAVYNGDGLRIKKVVPGTGETTIFAYDASNRLVAEYSTVVEPTATAKTSYLTTDHLGSPRITTDQFGQVASRRDFMPYGEEIARQNYGSDSVRQKFTGYERDNETKLDFAQARMHNFNRGRFSSPDPLMASAKRVLPQTWNRYTYVINNPLNLIDPSGMIWGRRSDGDGGYEYRWFPGKKVGEGWDVCTGDCLIVENPRIGRQSLGYAIRLNPNGFSWERVVSIDVPGQERRWLSHKDAQAINAITGGALCSFSMGLACPNAGEPIADNVKAAADTVQLAFLIKSLAALGIPAIAAILKKSPDEVLAIIRKMSTKELNQVIDVQKSQVQALYGRGESGADAALELLKRGEVPAGAEGLTRETLEALKTVSVNVLNRTTGITEHSRNVQQKRLLIVQTMIDNLPK